VIAINDIAEKVQPQVGLDKNNGFHLKINKKAVLSQGNRAMPQLFFSV